MPTTAETWRIEGLKIIGPTGEICTMTYDQARGGIGAHEIVSKQKLIVAAPKLLAACEAAEGWVLGSHGAHNVNGRCDCDRCETVRALRAAIAEALGK